MGKVTIDLVTERSDGALVLVLVEEGPWSAVDVEQELRRLQGRLFDCVEATVDGDIAQRYPRAMGGVVVIRLDCYNLPRRLIEALFRKFRDYVSQWDELKRDFAGKQMVSALEYE